MKPVTSYAQGGVSPAALITTATLKKTAVETPARSAPDSSSGADMVTLSGHSLLVSRLFGQDDSTYTGEVLAKNSASQSLTGYLTKNDRDMLEKMYDYSRENGLDLRHVDALAGDLGSYRKHGASREASGLYDTAGHAMTVTLSEANQKIADRIEVGDAISTSTIDQGFLRSEMVVGGHAANYAFLERMMSVFSTTTAQVSQEAPLAAYSHEANKLATTLSEDVQLVIPEADYTNVDGVGHWRTPELAAAHAAALAGLEAGNPNAMKEFLSMLDANTEKNTGGDQFSDGVKT